MTCTSLTCLFCEESAYFFAESDFAVSGVERNAIVLPSGDQTGDPAPFGASVSGRASPPSIEMRYICAGLDLPSTGSGVRTNATSRPFGDQRGERSLRPDVSGRGGALPSAGTTKTWVSYRSLSSLTLTRTNATCAPFGEICGSAAQTNLKRSVSVMSRRDCAWPAVGAAAKRRRNQSAGGRERFIDSSGREFRLTY